MFQFNRDFSVFLKDTITSSAEILEENQVRPDVALINLNKLLGEKKDQISQIPTMNRGDIGETISTVARQFPVIWSEKELYSNMKPNFPKEDYINYLSEINDSYKNLPLPNYSPPRNLNSLPNYEKTWMNITENEIEIFLSSMRNGRDLYGLSWDNLKKVSTIQPILLKFISKCFNEITHGKFSLSKEWCSANIIGRFKGGDRSDPKKFRPLTILPLFVRMYDSILSKKLHDIVLNYGIIDTMVQKAVIKNSNGLWENVFSVNMKINDMMKNNDNEKLFFFIDLKNAFGSVNYRTMLFILQKYNFSPEFSSYFERYYKNVFASYMGEEFKWKNGLFQGSALSNILFLIYIDYTMKNIFKDLRCMKAITEGYDLEENSYAFVDDIVMILPKDNNTEKTLKLLAYVMKIYGFQINADKTYFLVNDPEVKELKYNGILYKRATVDFSYLGNPLFIYQDEVLRNILDKTERCIWTIDSFNIPSEVKAYIYYINIFQRISRVIECFYLIRGKTELMVQIFELIGYFIYRWGVTEFNDYGKKHLEYIYAKGSTKLMKSPNLQQYWDLVRDVDIEKYGIEESKDHHFTDICGFESPKIDQIEENLLILKKNNYFPVEHYEKGPSGSYSENFVAWDC